jgi:lipopolysaccharide/colanic/teichoic acid biosynthesis glycosyltransferase
VGSWYLPGKLVIEFVIALGLLVPATPLILLFALLVRLTSPGPAFFTQRRLGRYGRPYTIYKLRTMTDNCESVSGPCWATPGDPRITRIGRFLRRHHLDELPQLWNVLRGEMSLVGPRPERPEIVANLEKAVAHYRGRLLVRPGMTGLAQLQLPADTDLVSVTRKLAYDLYYVCRISLWLDVCLLLGTLLYLMGCSIDLLPRLRLIPARGVVELAYRSMTGPARSVSHVQIARRPVPTDHELNHRGTETPRKQDREEKTS